MFCAVCFMCHVTRLHPTVSGHSPHLIHYFADTHTHTTLFLIFDGVCVCVGQRWLVFQKPSPAQMLIIDMAALTVWSGSVFLGRLVI